MVPERPLFWNVDGAWLFYALAALAVAAFVVGVGRHLRSWLRGAATEPVRLHAGAIGRVVLDGALGRRILRGDWAAGVMHGLVLWGFIGLLVATTVAGVDHYVVHFLSGDIYLAYSLAADVAGVAFVVGVLWAFARRVVGRKARLERRASDLLLLLWLFAIAATGFAVETLRLAVVRPPTADWCLGGLLARAFWSAPPDVAVSYPVLWWSHALLSLGLIAALPYTKLLHALVAPVHLLVADPRPPVATPSALPVPTDDEQAEGASGGAASKGTSRGQAASPDESSTKGGGQPAAPARWSRLERLAFDACTRCGRCVEACPSSRAGEPFSPRAVIVGLRAGLLAVGSRADHADAPAADVDPAVSWHCTACRACTEVCPVYLSPPETMRELRRGVVEEGTGVPVQLVQTLERLQKYGNPWESSKKRRAKWGDGLGLADLSRTGAGDTYCFFAGCTASLDTRAVEASRAAVALLERAGYTLGTLGKKEPCCGEISWSLGEDGLLEDQQERARDVLEAAEVERVVAASPHCLFALSSAAASERSPKPPIEMRHYVELLDDALERGTLELSGRVDARVSYHDPCFLGRVRGVFDAPRRVLRAIEGVSLVEMEHTRELSACCGGGGGRMWQEGLEGNAPISELRIREAAQTGADTLVTACPRCLVMLEDARRSAGLESKLRVLDLSELVTLALADAAPKGQEGKIES